MYFNVMFIMYDVYWCIHELLMSANDISSVLCGSPMSVSNTQVFT